MIRKNQSISLFQPIDSASRLKRVQSTLKKLSIPALILIAGLDGNNNVGTVRLIHYLLFGFSGIDLNHESIQDKSKQKKSVSFQLEDENSKQSSKALPTAILHQSDLDEIFIVIKQNSVIIYCTPQNSKFITNITSMWPNTEYFKPSLQDFQNDMELVENYKMMQFLRIVNELPQKVAAFPLTPTSKSPNGDIMEIEQWPLIQAYGLSDFEFGGFFTMKFQVEGIMNHIEPLFSIIDSQSLKILSSSHLENLKCQWDNVTASFDVYMSEHLNDIVSLKQLSEKELIEPLTTSYEFSSLKSLTPSETKKIGRPPYPRLLIGNRSGLDDELSGSYCIESQEIEEDGKVSHFILEGSDSQSPLTCCRTYFLQSAGLATDSLITKNIQTSKIIQSYNNNQTQVLMEIYVILLENFDLCCNLIRNSSTDSWKDLQKESKLFLSNYQSKHEFISSEAKQLISKIEPLVTYQIFNLSNYSSQTNIKDDTNLSILENGVIYLKLEYPFIEIANRNLGSLIFGETLAISKGYSESAFNNQILSLTQDIPIFTFFKADPAECQITNVILEAFEQRLNKNKLPHPKLQKELITIDNFTIAFSNSKFSRIQGESKFFTHGFTFNNPRFGFFSLSWENITEIILNQHAEGDPHFIEIKFKSSYFPYASLKYFKINSIILHFNPASRVRRLFCTHVLSEWKQSCIRAKIPFKEIPFNISKENEESSNNSDTSDLKKVIQFLDIEREKLKSIMKSNGKDESKQTLSYFSISNQTSREVSILDCLPEYKNLIQTFQLHDSGLSKKDIPIETDIRGIKTIPIHILTGGIRYNTIHIANDLIRIAKSEYNIYLVPIGGNQALNPHEEPEYDFKIFITQLIQAIKEGKSSNSIDNVHLLYIVPGFTDIERVVRGIQQLKQAKNIPINISSVSACINKNMLLSNHQVDTDVLPHVLRQCTNGFVMNIFLNRLESEEEREVEIILRRASPCAYISYVSYSESFPLYDAKEILKGNRFNTSLFVKARTLSSKNVGSDVKAVTIKCRPITFELQALKDKLNNHEMIWSKSFYCNGLACAVENDIQKLYLIIGFPSRIQLIPLETRITKDIQEKINRFYFYGKRIQEKELQHYLESSFVSFPSPKELLSRPALSYSDLENIRELYLLEDLPEGWNFDGTMFLDPEGVRVRNHPNFEFHIQKYISEKNKEIETYNSSIPTTNIQFED